MMYLVILWSLLFLSVVFAYQHTIYTGIEDETWIYHFGDALLFTGMFLIGTAYTRPGRVTHLVASAGWQMFAVYWLMQIPLNMYRSDTINLMFLGGSMAFFTTLSYHEYVSSRSGTHPRGLRFIEGATFITGGLYFLAAKVPVLSLLIIRVVASHTSVLVNMLWDYGTYLSAPTMTAQEGIAIPIENSGGTDVSGISLILACTGIEAMVMFIGAILCTNMEWDPWRRFKHPPKRAEFYRRMRPEHRAVLGFLATVPVIYVLNLVRNMAIIYFLREGTFTEIAHSFGMDEFYFLHGLLLKIFSFSVLLGLAFVIFDIMPELQDEIVSLYNLYKRDTRKMMKREKKGGKG